MGLFDIDEIKQGLLNQWQEGAPVRGAIGGLLNGDLSAISQQLQSLRQFPKTLPKGKPLSSNDDIVRFAMDYAPMGMGTVGKVANKAKTKYDLAHELAQKNATKMLGLPPNNTAMDRARAMGFDTPAYHGTEADISQFNPSMADTRRKTGTPVNTAAVVSSNPASASTYAGANRGEWSTSYSDGGNVMPLLVNNGKNLSMNASAADKYYTPHWNDVFDPKYPDIQTTNDFAELAKSKKKDSATIKNVKDNAVMSGEEGNTTFVFNPANLRSRFAAFDPAKRNQADILGNIDPTLLMGLAVGSGAGTYAYKNRNK